MKTEITISQADFCFLMTKTQKLELRMPDSLIDCKPVAIEEWNDVTLCYDVMLRRELEQFNNLSVLTTSRAVLLIFLHLSYIRPICLPAALMHADNESWSDDADKPTIIGGHWGASSM